MWSILVVSRQVAEAHTVIYMVKSQEKVSLLRQQLKKVRCISSSSSAAVIKGSNRRTGIMADAIGAIAVPINAGEQSMAIRVPNVSNRVSSCRLRSLVQRGV
jgi:hypothetical protein